MIAETSNYYYSTPSWMEGNRLDFVFHHPELEPVRRFRQSDAVVPLISVVTRPEYGLSKSGLPEGSVGFLNVQHLTFNGEIFFEPPTYLASCDEESLLREGDILIARTGHTLGKAALITARYDGFTFGSFCLRFSILPNANFSNEFVTRFLNSRMGQLQILMLKSGSGKYNINAEQILDIRIPNYDIDRQNEIIATVKEIEATAVTLRRQAEGHRSATQDVLLQELNIPFAHNDNVTYFFKSGAEKQTIWFNVFPDEIADRMQYLFYHPRFEALDRFTHNYRTASLISICTTPIIRGEQPSYDEEGDVTVLKTIDLKNGYIDYESALRVSADFFEAHPNAQVQRGDILVASTGYVSLGKVDVYDRDEPAIVDGHISIVRVNENYNPYFLAYFLRSHLGQLQFEKWFTGSSGQIELQPPDLAKFIVPACGTGNGYVSLKNRIALLSVLLKS